VLVRVIVCGRYVVGFEYVKSADNISVGGNGVGAVVGVAVPVRVGVQLPVGVAVGEASARTYKLMFACGPYTGVHVAVDTDVYPPFTA